MIKSFKHKGLRDFFENGSRRGIAPDQARRIELRLDVLNAAANIGDINVQGFDLHELKGDRAGTWSLSVSGNWRVSFRFENGDAYDVDLEDYH